jgi:hypothetical protein
MKTKKKHPNQVWPTGSAGLRAEHHLLRSILSHHQPVRYALLRTEHDFQPSRLEYAYQIYPEVFASGTTPQGQPTIRLLEGELESYEDLTNRHRLMRMIKKAALTGVRLKTLYDNTDIDSKTIKRLLGGQAQISVTGKDPKLLYKWIGEAEKKSEPALSRIQDSLAPANQLPEPIGEPSDELELTRQKLVVLCEKSWRHRSWLTNFMDEGVINRVLATWPQDFETEKTDLGGGPALIIRVKRPPATATPSVAADATVTSAPQMVSAGPVEPLGEVFDFETLEELKWKPASAGMGSRRNGRAVVRGDRIVR